MDIDTIAQDYERDGVVRIADFVTRDALHELRQRVDAYIATIAPQLPAGDVVYEADGRAVRNLWRMEQYDAYFADFAHQPQTLALVRRLVNGEPVLKAVETFNKPARVGSGVPPHQDNAYFCQSPPDVLTIWIALEPATQENGPVYYVPGSHRHGMRPHKPSGVKGNSIGLVEPFDREAPFVGTLDPGDALIHHCQTIHYSGPNRSDRSRLGLLMVFNAEHARDDPTLKEAYQRALATLQG